jgi:hypothetical protein
VTAPDPSRQILHTKRNAEWATGSHRVNLHFKVFSMAREAERWCSGVRLLMDFVGPDELEVISKLFLRLPTVCEIWMLGWFFEGGKEGYSLMGIERLISSFTM